MPELDENEALVTLLFQEHFSFHIEKLPEGQRKTSDFLAFDGSDHYLIELKTKYRNEKDTSARDMQLREHGTAIFVRSLERKSKISKNISEAISQIESSNSGRDALRILFFLLRDFDSDEVAETILANLYGIETVVDWADKGEKKQCYYFNFSDNYRYRDRLDATIIMKERSGEANLCLNDHSPMYETIRNSRLAAHFSDGLIDPIRREEAGEIWLVLGDIDRSSKAAVIGHLREKYSLSERTMSLTMNYVSATTAIPTKGDPN